MGEPGTPGMSMSGARVVASIAELRALAAGVAPFVLVAGYRTQGDGGGGVFVWDASTTAADDRGTVIAPTVTSLMGRWRRLFTGALSVRWFGATGDGVTDDAADIQAALDAGAVVHLPAPPVAYLLRRGLNLSRPRQTLLGEGSRSILRAATATFDLITVAGAEDVVIRHLQLQGAATDAQTSQWGVMTSETQPPRRLRVEGVTFSGEDAARGLNNGVKFNDGADDGTVTECVFERLHGATSGAGYGVLTGRVARVHVRGCRFQGSPGRGRHAVYLSTGATWCVVAHNTVEAFNEEHLTLNARDAQPPNAFNLIAHNTCRGGTQNPSSALISIFGKATHNKIVGNVLEASNASGVVINASSGPQSYECADNEVAGNTILRSRLVGIDVLGALRTRIVGNTVHDSSVAAPGTHSNIRLVTDGRLAARDTVVLGNTSTGSGARSPFQLNDSTPVPSGTVLKGNHFPALMTAGVELLGIATAIDGRVRHRQAWDPPPLAVGASVSLSVAVRGADQGDVVTVGFTSNIDECQLTAYASGTGAVTVVLSNHSGMMKDVAPGTLSIDVWKADP